jgi:hypothetical protein
LAQASRFAQSWFQALPRFLTQLLASSKLGLLYGSHWHLLASLKAGFGPGFSLLKESQSWHAGLGLEKLSEQVSQLFVSMSLAIFSP